MNINGKDIPSYCYELYQDLEESVLNIRGEILYEKENETYKLSYNLLRKNNNETIVM